jgi:hypothetical protein
MNLAFYLEMRKQEQISHIPNEWDISELKHSMIYSKSSSSLRLVF